MKISEDKTFSFEWKSTLVWLAWEWDTQTLRQTNTESKWHDEVQRCTFGAVNRLSALLLMMWWLQSNEKKWWWLDNHKTCLQEKASSWFTTNILTGATWLPGHYGGRDRKVEWTQPSLTISLNIYLQRLKYRGDNRCRLFVKSLRRDSVIDWRESIEVVINITITGLPVCVSYMSSQCREDPRSLIHLGRLQWQTHHRVCLVPSSPGGGMSRRDSGWPNEGNTNTTWGKVPG